ncbi:MAG: hypothetical protein ACKO7D_00885 [Bacteroidota bacterium]
MVNSRNVVMTMRGAGLVGVAAATDDVAATMMGEAVQCGNGGIVNWCGNFRE